MHIISLLLGFSALRVLPNFIRCWDFPTRWPNSVEGILPLIVPSSQLRWWAKPHSEAYVNPTPLLGFPPLGGQKFAGTTSEIISQAKPLPRQTNHVGNKNQHSQEVWSFWFQKANCKANHARSKQTFPFQRNLYMFYSGNLYIPNTYYLITSNKSNIKFHYTSVLTFLKKIQMIPIWSL